MAILESKIRYIKIARIDGNGTDLTTTLESLSNIVLPLSTNNRVYRIANRSRFRTYFLFYVIPPDILDIPEVDVHNPNYDIQGSITSFKFP